MSSVRSRKQKGKRLQNKTRDILIRELTRYGISVGENDIISTPAGVPGNDIVLSSRIKTFFPFAIENKNTEQLNIWKAIEQVRARMTPDEWEMVVFSKNRESIYVTLNFNVFLEIYQFYLEHLKVHNGI